jgi:hypothetical protein
MEQEHDLQATTGGYLDDDYGARSGSIDRILREQQVRLGVNITLLEQRYQMLPSPGRFQGLRERHRPPTRTRQRGESNVNDTLRNLVAQHLSLLGRIQLLIAQGPDGQQGALILTEVAHNHEEMAWMLTALFHEELSVHALVPLPVIAHVATTKSPSEATWENEGGATRSSAASGSAGTGRVA